MELESVVEEKISSIEPKSPLDFTNSNFNFTIPRKFLEAITGTATSTILKYEHDGVISANRVKRESRDIATYTPADVMAVLKKRGVSFKKKETAEVIGVFSQKGGIGKSSITSHFGGMMSMLGKTLIIDLDSQGDATSLLGAEKQHHDVMEADQEVLPTVIELIDFDLSTTDEVPYRNLPVEQVVRKVSDTLDVIGADLDLAEFDYVLSNYPFNDKTLSDGKDIRGSICVLKSVIDKLKYKYDFIIFDMPPNIGQLNLAALLVADRVVSLLELEAKSLSVCTRNESFLRRLMDLSADFRWDKVLLVPNKLSINQKIKMKALTRAHDLYGQDQENNFINISNIAFPQSTIIDKCADAKEPVFASLLKSAKGNKDSVKISKEFTNMLWVMIHEVLDIPIQYIPFADELDKA